MVVPFLKIICETLFEDFEKHMFSGKRNWISGKGSSKNWFKKSKKLQQNLPELEKSCYEKCWKLKKLYRRNGKNLQHRVKNYVGKNYKEKNLYWNVFYIKVSDYRRAIYENRLRHRCVLVSLIQFPRNALIVYSKEGN